ncbi:MAG: 2-hydroxychromene-2-carboxylate isomerase [Pseudomonadota bacterium]
MAKVTYVFSAHSAFAYLGSERLAQICRQHGAQLIHKPILLSPVVEAQGGQPFAMRTQAHVDYFFGREIERWAEYRNVPIINHRPTHHDADYTLAAGMIIALGDSGPAVDAMAHALLQAHWRDDADLSDHDALRAVASALGHDWQSLFATAASEKVQQTLQDNTAWARDNGVFGSPTYFVDGDMFYGQDRLELVARALQQSFEPARFRNPKTG